MNRGINQCIMSSEERRRSPRISELEARNAQQRRQKENAQQRRQKEIKMTLDSEDEQSNHKRGRKRVKTRPLQDLISNPAERQASGVEPPAKKLVLYSIIF